MSGDTYSLGWQLHGPESECLLELASKQLSHSAAGPDLMAIHVMPSPISGPLLFLLPLRPAWVKDCFRGKFSEITQLPPSLLLLHSALISTMNSSTPNRLVSCPPPLRHPAYTDMKYTLSVSLLTEGPKEWMGDTCLLTSFVMLFFNPQSHSGQIFALTVYIEPPQKI